MTPKGGRDRRFERSNRLGLERGAHCVLFIVAAMVAFSLSCATQDASSGQLASTQEGALGGGAHRSPRGEGARGGNRSREGETQLALNGLACRSAGATLESWVRSRPEVSRASFDSKSVTLTVTHDRRRLGRRELARLVESRGLEVELGGDQGSIRPPVFFPPEMDVRGLPEVYETQLEDHLVHGKVTVFHLRAPSGEVCSDIELTLAVLMQSMDDIALRRVPSTGAPEVVVYAATAHRYGPFREDEVEAIEEAIRAAAGGETIRLND